MREVIKHVAPIPGLLTLPDPQRLQMAEGDTCWKRVGLPKEVSAQDVLPTWVPVHYLLVKATWQCHLLRREEALKLNFPGQQLVPLCVGETK